MYNVEKFMWNNKIKIKNQRKLAKALGLNECHISKIVNKRITCPKTTALAITSYLGIDLDKAFTKVK